MALKNSAKNKNTFSLNEKSDPFGFDSESIRNQPNKNETDEFKENEFRGSVEEEIASTFVEINNNENSFDDSDVDPNYAPNETDSDSISEQEFLKSDCQRRKVKSKKGKPLTSCEIDEMGAQIERNLYAETVEEGPGEIENPATQMEIDSFRETNTQNIDTPSSISTTKKENQRRRNTGQSYVGCGNKLIEARRCIPLQKCRNMCMNKISFEQQQIIFKKYWSLGKYDLRMIYVSGLIKVNATKRKTTLKSGNNQRNRENAYVYHVEVDGVHQVVCQKCFLYTLGETDNFIKSVAKKKLKFTNVNCLRDFRGSSTPATKFNDAKIDEIKRHILSFPSYESHYSRRHTNQLYFQSDLNVTKMHKLYCEINHNPASLSKYSQVFKGMGIKFKKPKLDTCNKCDILKAKIEIATNVEEKLILQNEQKSHHEAATKAYDAKKEDKSIAQISQNTTVCYTFDLQQCLPTPLLQTSVTFYKRPLWTFNLTVHDCVTNAPYCYMWHEAIGGRGGNDISSCIFRHLLNLPESIKSAVFWSDSCAGQNKNSFMAAMFAISVANSTHLEQIDHKFLVPGHTHMECDSGHAIIEKRKRKTTAKIHHPRDWYQFVRTVGTERKFNVVEMTCDKFYKFSDIAKQKFTFRKVDVEGNKFSWNLVKWLRFTREVGKIYYKNSLDEQEPFKALEISKRGVGNIAIKDIPKSYTGQLKINSEKKKDLISMLPLIDEEFHSFYQNLNSDDLIRNTDPDLIDEDENY